MPGAHLTFIKSPKSTASLTSQEPWIYVLLGSNFFHVRTFIPDSCGSRELRSSCPASCSTFCCKCLFFCTTPISVMGFLCVGQVDSVWGRYYNAFIQCGVLISNKMVDDIIHICSKGSFALNKSMTFTDSTCMMASK